MKNELKKLNKKITKNNESFHEFYSRTNFPYQVAREQWIHRHEKIEIWLKIIAFIVIALLLIMIGIAGIILN